MARSETVRIRRLIEAALAILSAEWPMTVRQLFYRLVSVQHVENSRGDYQKVSRIMTKARDDGRCPFKWIVDRSRPEYAPNVFWTEKDAVVGSIQAVTDELGIRVRVGRGFLSTTKAHEIAERFAQIDKPIMVFYLGDHDPSGRNIEADVRERVLAHGSGPFSLKRLAIHAGDIRRFNLPPLRVKHTDSRAGEFLAKYSNACVELDALPPSELRRRIQEAVAGLLDASLWNRAIAVEQVELASIADTIARWPRGGEQLTN